MLLPTKKAKKKMTIGVCLPSRGYVYSRTMEDILKNTQGRTDIKFFFSHGKPIPECSNYMVEEALKAGVDYIWFVEDDQKFPVNILDQLLAYDTDIVTCDYPINKTGHVVATFGDVTLTGFGCTLVKAKIFDKLLKPYFSTDYEYQIQDKMLLKQPALQDEKRHGRHDIDFYYRLYDAGVKVVVHHTPVGHYYFKSPQLPKIGNKTALEYDLEVWEF